MWRILRKMNQWKILCEWFAILYLEVKWLVRNKRIFNFIGISICGNEFCLLSFFECGEIGLDCKYQANIKLNYCLLKLLTINCSLESTLLISTPSLFASYWEPWFPQRESIKRYIPSILVTDWVTYKRRTAKTTTRRRKM